MLVLELEIAEQEVKLQSFRSSASQRSFESATDKADSAVSTIEEEGRKTTTTDGAAVPHAPSPDLGNGVTLEVSTTNTPSPGNGLVPARKGLRNLKRKAIETDPVDNESAARKIQRTIAQPKPVRPLGLHRNRSRDHRHGMQGPGLSFYKPYPGPSLVEQLSQGLGVDLSSKAPQTSSGTLNAPASVAPSSHPSSIAHRGPELLAIPQPQSHTTRGWSDEYKTWRSDVLLQHQQYQYQSYTQPAVTFEPTDYQPAPELTKLESQRPYIGSPPPYKSPVEPAAEPVNSTSPVQNQLNSPQAGSEVPTHDGHDGNFVHTQNDSFSNFFSQPPPVVGGIGDHSFMYSEHEDSDNEGSETDDNATEYNLDAGDEEVEAAREEQSQHDTPTEDNEQSQLEEEQIDLLKLSGQAQGPMYWP